MRNVSILIIKFLQEMFARKYGWPNSTHNTCGLTVLGKTCLLFQLGFTRASKKYVKTDVKKFQVSTVHYDSQSLLLAD